MRVFLLAGLLGVFLSACGGDELSSSSTSDGGGGTGATSSTGTSDGGGGAGGTGGSTTASLDELLEALRADPQSAMLAQANEGGWPALVEGGYLFVTTDPTLDKVAGDHDAWTGTDLTQDEGFRWIVLSVASGSQYKLTNLTDWTADPWARSYTYDDFGEMSLVDPSVLHVERFFEIGDAAMAPRTIRILVPEQAPTHVLYTHDGQNLFDPGAFFGGWKIQDSVPPAMLVVGIDNTPARMDEYTHVPDIIDAGTPSVGGLGDAYADYLKTTVRPLVAKHYGEPAVRGTMGSSLGGLISLHIADRHPGEYAFAASLSGTLGWGSIGDGVHNETMIERYASHGHQGTALYLESGGDGGACGDTDGDGVDDDVDLGDNYCENAQMYGLLQSLGYLDDVDLTYLWVPGAPHNEAAWASRVSVPLQIFAGL
jgi:hypothetical protein